MLKGDTGCSAVCSSRDYCQDNWYHNHCWGQTRREARRARIHISALCETIRFAEGCGSSQHNLFSLFWWSFDHHCSKEGKLTALIVGWELLCNLSEYLTWGCAQVVLWKHKLCKVSSKFASNAELMPCTTQGLRPVHTSKSLNWHTGKLSLLFLTSMSAGFSN